MTKFGQAGIFRDYSMQCVILAAGEGVRMRPLTLTTPKPMLTILGKPLLAHTIDALPREITDVILVVGYLQEQIRTYFGDAYGGRSITYVVQSEKLGTYRALELCRHLLSKDRFLVLYADDLFGPRTYAELVKAKGMVITVAEVTNPERFGVVVLNPDGTVKEIEEKPEHPKTNLANAGPSLLTDAVFECPPPKHKNGEYVLAESVSLLAKRVPVRIIRADWWLPIGYPEDLAKAEEFLRSNR